MKYLIGIAFLLAPAAYAEVAVHDLQAHYRIEGDSEAALRDEMNAKGPLGKDGRRYTASTRWDLGWVFRFQESAGTCAIASVAVDVTITMLTPAWRTGNTAPDALRQRWRDYVAALQAHEMVHRKHAVEAAHEVEAGILGLPPHGTCKALEAAANTLGLEIVEKYRLRDIEFDRVTDHGRADRVGFQ